MVMCLRMMTCECDFKRYPILLYSRVSSVCETSNAHDGGARTFFQTFSYKTVCLCTLIWTKTLLTLPCDNNGGEQRKKNHCRTSRVYTGRNPEPRVYGYSKVGIVHARSRTAQSYNIHRTPCNIHHPTFRLSVLHSVWSSRWLIMHVSYQTWPVKKSNTRNITLGVCHTTITSLGTDNLNFYVVREQFLHDPAEVVL